MTRYEEIKEAAKEYSIYTDATDVEDRCNSTELEAFKAGAEWADKHPYFDEKDYNKKKEEFDRRHQERMDKRGEITSFANRW